MQVFNSSYTVIHSTHQQYKHIWAKPVLLAQINSRDCKSKATYYEAKAKSRKCAAKANKKLHYKKYTLPLQQHTW